MQRSLLAAVLGAAALASSSSVLIAQAQNQPGLPTIARVQILNRERDEAVPVKVQNTGDSLPVILVGEPTVSFAPTSVVGSRAARQAWEYRRLVVPAAQDATLALNGAGSEGWEAVGGMTVGTNVIWTLKRPR